jgi:hypothetical protein
MTEESGVPIGKEWTDPSERFTENEVVLGACSGKVTLII